MILHSRIIEFKDMPLFQKARFRTPLDMQGSFADFACFFYMVEGNMLSYDSRGVNRLGEKEAVIKSCNNYVQRYMPSEGSEECEAVAVYLYPDLLREIFKDEAPSFIKKEGIPVPKSFIGNRLIEQYINNLAIYFENPDALDEELGVLKLKELIMILLKSEGHQDVRNLLSEIFTPVNVEFKQTVEEHIFHPLNMDQLAFICNMSLSSFKRVFKKTFGETPAKYIKHRRLEHAADLLLCKDESVTAIAFDSGFQDVTTFSASFQEKYGQSPSSFRLDRIRN